MRASITNLVVLAALLIGSLVSGTAVSARDSNGAQVIDIHWCTPSIFGPGVTECYRQHLEVRNFFLTPNPAGNGNGELNGWFCDTFTAASGTVVSQYCDQEHAHVLVKDGMEHETTFFDKQSITTAYGGECITLRYHDANGRVVFFSLTTTAGAC